MLETVIVALMFAVLLGIEWRYQLGSVRLGAAMLSVIVLLFAQPSFTTAARRVSLAPPEARITQLHGSTISEYESGVATMVRAIDEAHEERGNVRLLALGVLLWLACSPVLWRARRPSFDDASAVRSRERDQSAAGGRN